MTNTDYLIEVSVLSTVLFAHQQYSEEEFFTSFELQEEWFLIPFHRLVVKTINHTKAKGLPIYEEFIVEELQKNNALDFQLWTAIISGNPFSRVGFETYVKSLMKPKTSLHQGI